MRPITYVGGDATRPGGDWAVIAAIIEEEVCARPIAATVYDPPADSQAQWPRRAFLCYTTPR